MKTSTVTPAYDFVEYVLKCLVDHPEDVKIEQKTDEMGVLFSLNVNPNDRGQVIGKKGSTIQAIKTLVRNIGLRNHARINIRILEEPGENTSRRFQKKEEPSTATELEDLKL